MRWIIIDDNEDTCKAIEENLQALQQENTSCFIPSSRIEFEKNKEERVNVTPPYDYKGKYKDKDDQELYQIIKEAAKQDDKIVFLIDILMDGLPFCGFDILHLIRCTMDPKLYQVRFISGLPRNFMTNFLDAEFGNKLKILGDRTTLSFFSKVPLTLTQCKQILTEEFVNEIISSFDEGRIDDTFWLYEMHNPDADIFKKRSIILNGWRNCAKEKNGYIENKINYDSLKKLKFYNFGKKRQVFHESELFLFRHEKELWDAELNKPSSLKELIFFSQDKQEEHDKQKPTLVGWDPNNIEYVHDIEELRGKIFKLRPRYVIIHLPIEIEEQHKQLLAIAKIMRNIPIFEVNGFGLYFLTSLEKGQCSSLVQGLRGMVSYKVHLTSNVDVKGIIGSPIYSKFMMTLFSEKNIGDYYRHQISHLWNTKGELDENKKNILFEEVKELNINNDYLNKVQEHLKKNKDIKQEDLLNLIPKDTIVWILVGQNEEIESILKVEIGQYKKAGLLSQNDTLECISDISTKENLNNEVKNICNNKKGCKLVFLFPHTMPCYPDEQGYNIGINLIKKVCKDNKKNDYAFRILYKKENGKWSLKDYGQGLLLKIDKNTIEGKIYRYFNHELLKPICKECKAKCENDECSHPEEAYKIACKYFEKYQMAKTLIMKYDYWENNGRYPRIFKKNVESEAFSNLRETVSSNRFAAIDCNKYLNEDLLETYVSSKEGYDIKTKENFVSINIFKVMINRIIEESKKNNCGKSIKDINDIDMQKIIRQITVSKILKDNQIVVEQNNQCSDFLIYSYGSNILTVDRVHFIREDFKRTKSNNLNTEIHRLIDKYSKTTDNIDINLSGEKLHDLEWEQGHHLSESTEPEYFFENRLYILRYFIKNMDKNFYVNAEGLKKEIKINEASYLRNRYCFNIKSNKQGDIMIQPTSIYPYEKKILIDFSNNDFEDAKKWLI